MFQPFLSDAEPPPHFDWVLTFSCKKKIGNSAFNKRFFTLSPQVSPRFLTSLLPPRPSSSRRHVARNLVHINDSQKDAGKKEKGRSRHKKVGQRKEESIQGGKVFLLSFRTGKKDKGFFSEPGFTALFSMLLLFTNIRFVGLHSCISTKPSVTGGRRAASKTQIRDLALFPVCY